MPLDKKILFWCAAILGVCGFFWLFSPILTPFVLGAAIAYFLNPLTTRLSHKFMPRWVISLMILLLFFTFIGLLGILIAPIVMREGGGLVAKLPALIDQSITLLTPYLTVVEKYFGAADIEQLKALMSEHAGKILSLSGGVIDGVAQGGQAAMSAIITLILTPLVAFFMMADWPCMTGFIDGLYPRDDRANIRGLIRQMDRKISGFVRGQILVAFLLGMIYALALSLAGLQYGFLLGIISGVLSVIPFVGSAVGLITGVMMAWFQTGSWEFPAIIAAIFMGGQFIEGNFLTPKLVGDRVGLHPLWVIFALMAGGSMLGLLGMLIAVPVAAMMGVLAGFFITQYKSGPLYQVKP